MLMNTLLQWLSLHQNASSTRPETIQTSNFFSMQWHPFRSRRRLPFDKALMLLVSLLLLQLSFVGFHIVSRVALNIGVSKVEYPVYKSIIALILLGPFAYFMEKKERSPLTSLFAPAMQNSVPAITFLMASTLGGLVFLLHGLNEHCGRYNDFAKKLNANGFKVYGMDWIVCFKLSTCNPNTFTEPTCIRNSDHWCIELGTDCVLQLL